MIASCLKERIMQVGDNIYYYDYNARRVDENNKYMGHGEWVGHTITGETSRSWLIHFNRGDVIRHKVSKAGLTENLGKWGDQKWFDYATMLDMKWVQENQRDIEDMVKRCRNVELLKKIHGLLNAPSLP